MILQACFQQPVFGGTAILAKRTAEFAVVAADSRVISTEGQPRDYQTCKIQLLDANSFFASAGATSNRGGIRGELAFDSREEAKHVYRTATSLNTISSEWANAMEAIYSSQPETWKRPILTALKKNQINDKVIVQAIFGRSDNNTVDVRQVEINYDDTSVAVSFSHKPPTEVIDDENSITYWETSPAWQFIARLLRGDTPESASWRSAIAGQAIKNGYLPVDGYALEMKTAMEAAISAGADPAVGGDIAVLILERDRPARWFAEAATCKK